MYAPVGVSGLFGCDIDKSQYPTVRVYPGKANLWVIAKRAGASGIVNDIVRKWIDPIDTSSWYEPDLPFAVVQDTADGVRQMVSSDGRVIVQNATEFPKPPVLGSGRQFYIVLFNAPSDAPSEIVWPVVGCPESADWALLWTTSSKPAVLSPSQAATSAQPVTDTAQAMDARRAEAERALRESMESGEAGGFPWKTLLLTAALAGAGYYAWRKGKLPLLPALRSR